MEVINFEEFSSFERQGLYHFGEMTEGYDYEFVPPADPKYTCPVCMLILREPVQTGCGHRFCKTCITRCLKESSKRCPLDNAEIDDSQIFPDNFAKREILSLTVRCPNSEKGCDTVVELKCLTQHFESCPMAFQPCPNHCTDIMLRRDLNDHLVNVCCRRKVTCHYCMSEMLAEDLENHATQCPLAIVSCQFCGSKIVRNQLQEHHDKECINAVVKCMYYRLGCNEQIERSVMRAHLESSIHCHMELVCDAFIKLLMYLGVERIGDQPNLPTSGLTPTEISGEVSTMVTDLHDLLSADSNGALPSNPLAKQVGCSGALQNLLRINRSVSDKTNSKFILSEDPIVGSSSMLTARVEQRNVAHSYLLGNEFHSLKQQNTYQDESLARHNQKLLELQGKCESLEHTARELKQKVRILEDKLSHHSEMEGRFCNGSFIWKIKNYSHKRREAETGETMVLHSPPFFSNFYGYKLCIRANLNGVDTALGTHLSLFIHFMQGEYDDILIWPFHGKIILSVLDQNPVCECRQHTVETLVAKPNLAAFQKPVGHRNHKGFGYMEFMPLRILDNSPYVRNDTLIIRAQVFPEAS